MAHNEDFLKTKKSKKQKHIKKNRGNPSYEEQVFDSTLKFKNVKGRSKDSWKKKIFSLDEDDDS